MKTQREIKFRMWDFNNHKFITDGFSIDMDGWAWHDDNDNSHRLDGSYELQQSTGLKDKNGVDIYEGDIIDISNGEKFIVYWDNQYDFCFKKSDTNTGYHKTYRGATREEGWIIIGNIYENTELIKN